MENSSDIDRNATVIDDPMKGVKNELSIASSSADRLCWESLTHLTDAVAGLAAPDIKVYAVAEPLPDIARRGRQRLFY
jgi:hypothetical protein